MGFSFLLSYIMSSIYKDMKSESGISKGTSILVVNLAQGTPAVQLVSPVFWEGKLTVGFYMSNQCDKCGANRENSVFLLVPFQKSQYNHLHLFYFSANSMEKYEFSILSPIYFAILVLFTCSLACFYDTISVYHVNKMKQRIIKIPLKLKCRNCNLQVCSL